jgi:hypothetical protein
MDFLNRFLKNTQISNLMKICPVGAELFHADRRTDGHSKANSPKTCHWQNTSSSKRPTAKVGSGICAQTFVTPAQVVNHNALTRAKVIIHVWGKEGMLQPFTAHRIFACDQYIHTTSDSIHTLPPPPVLPRPPPNVPHYLRSFLKHSNPLKQRWTPMMNPLFLPNLNIPWWHNYNQR